MSTCRSPLQRLWIAACAACLLAGCEWFGSSDASPTVEAAEVRRPRVAMLSGDSAAIAYDAVDTIAGLEAHRELRTLRHSLATGASDGMATHDVYDDTFDGSNPVAMSAGRDGFAISLVAGDSGTGGATTRRPQGCVHTLSSPATCTPLQSEWGHTVAVTHGEAGQAIVIYGSGNVRQQRIYDQATGWGPSRPGPSLVGDYGEADDRTLVRWRDGSMFIAGATATTIFAVRYDPVSANWRTPEELDSPGGLPPPARMALHPDSPTASPIAVWELAAGGIRYSVWQDGPGWSAAAPVPGSSAGARRPTVDMWPSGDALVVWDAGPAGARGVVAARRVAGAWQAPATLGPSSDSPKRIALGVDRFGNAVALWANGGALMSANYVVNEGWHSATSIGFLADLGGSADLDVAMEPGGRAVAVWAEPEPAGQPGSRLAIAAVGPSVLSATAQRYTFGGEVIPVTIRLASPPAVATTAAVTTTLPDTAVTVPPSVPIAANQTEVTFDIPSSTVSDFVNGSITVTYGSSSGTQPVTLMPEPSGLAVQVAPSSVLGGEAATITLQVSPAYPVAMDIALASDQTIAPVPSRVGTSPGTSSTTVPITTLSTFSTLTAVFTARLRGLTNTGSLQIDPTAPGDSVLTVSIGLPSGTVTSTPAGINACALTCTATYPVGMAVTLTPVAGAGFRFFAWEGDADCSDGKLTMQAARNCRAIFLPTDPPYPDGSGWAPIGAPVVGLSYVNPSPALALEGVTPVVAYLKKELTPPSAVPQLYVRRLQGGSFVLVGAGSLNVDKLVAASEPAIAATPAGLPYVAWIEGSGARQNLYVVRLDFSGGSAAWLSVGPLNAPLNYAAGSRAASPSIALDAELQPMVAWIEDGAVKFKRFDGTAWVPAAGGQGPTSAGADRVRLSSYPAQVGSDAPVIAWTQGSGMSRALKVVRGDGFTPLGTQVNAASLNPLTEFGLLGEDGGGIVTWGDGESPFTVRSQRWNGSAWSNVAGNNVVNNNPNRLLSVAMPRNGLDAAYLWTPPVGAGFVSLGVSSKRPGNDWMPITTLFTPSFAGNVVGPMPVEFASGTSPIVVYVSRNSADQYSWSVVRYFPP